MGSQPKAPAATPPSSSSVPAEAIQAEVQRQLGGLLNRLQQAEDRNKDLHAELERYRQRETEQAWSPWTRNENPAAAGPTQAPGLVAEIGEGPGLPDREAASVPAPPDTWSGGQQTGISSRPYVHESEAQSFPRLSTAPLPPASTVTPGLLESIMGRVRSPSPPPPPRAGSDAAVLNALTQGMKQLQDLQMQAMSKATSSSQLVEIVKPGTTNLAPIPQLRGDSLATAALEFQDWLEVAGSVMSDVSESSGQWWQLVIKQVDGTYHRWLGATPLERLQVFPEQSFELCTGRWVRLNARVTSMMLGAMDESLRADMVSQRLTQDTVKMLFRLHTLFQPGGSAERYEMLRRLQTPSEFLQGGDSLAEALKVVRAWPRWLSRCQAVKMSPPDPSVLAKGLASVTSKYIQGSEDASFRTAMLRTTLRLDGQPSLDQVMAYQKHLQAELETLVATTSTTPTPKVRAADARALDKTDKAKDKEKGELCRYFMKSTGCRRGMKCNYAHSMASLDRETRSKKCLQCGSESHRQKECPVGKGGSKGKSTSSSAHLAYQQADLEHFYHHEWTCCSISGRGRRKWGSSSRRALDPGVASSGGPTDCPSAGAAT